MLPDESRATELGPPAGRVKVEIGDAFPFDLAANCRMDVSSASSWTTYTLMAGLVGVTVGSSVSAAPRAWWDPQTVVATIPININLVRVVIKYLK
jgi:hypothetical protein